MKKVSSNVKLYGICSEGQDNAHTALHEWRLNNYEAVIGDAENKLVRYIKETYLPKLHVTDCTRRTELDPELNAMAYPKGAVQPAVLFFVGDKPALGWACVPTPANLQGALGRPDPMAVWKVVEECKALADQGKTFEMNDGEDLPKTVTFAQAVANCCHCIIL